MKYTKVICPACAQPIEIPNSMRGGPVECPSCATQFTAPVTAPFRFRIKLRNVIALAIFALVMFGVYRFRVARENETIRSMGGYELPGRKPETQLERAARYESDARELFAAAITNDVIGYTRTIKSECWVSSATPVTNWFASATVEHINPRGGIERTTLYWRFKESFGDIRIIPHTFR